jgi:hypothetical protein
MSRLSVCLSFRMQYLGSHLTDFREIWYYSTFRNSVQKIQDSLKPDKNNGYFKWSQIYVFDHISAHLFLEWEMFHTKFVEKIKTHIFEFNNLKKNRAIY